MAQAAYHIVYPGKKLLFQYTTSSSSPAEEAGGGLKGVSGQWSVVSRQWWVASNANSHLQLTTDH